MTVPETIQAMAPMIIFLVVAYGAMYLFIVRPQQQQQRKRAAMLKELKKGDRIVTAGGLIGWVAAIKEDTIRLKLAEKLEVELEKSAIVRAAGEE